MAQTQKGGNPAKSATSNAKPASKPAAGHAKHEDADAPKVLRIGIVQGGKIVEERVVRKRTSITIGQSSANTFVVPASNALPKSFTLFELVQNQYALNFLDGMDGRIASDGNTAPQTLAQLKGQATRQGPLYRLPLVDKSRGKVVIGDLTVLFQFVAAPPIAARPQLPPSVRGSLIQNLDWMMVGIAAASVVAHFAFVFYLRSIDWPQTPDIENIPDRFVHMIVPKREEKPKEEQKVDPNAEKKAAEEAKEKKQKAKEAARAKEAAKQKDPEQAAREAAERKARLAEEVKSKAMLNILGAKGEGGSIMDRLAGGGVGNSADKVFAEVGGVSVAGGSGIGTRGGGGSGEAKGIGGLRADGPGEVSTGSKSGERAAVLKGHVKDATATVDEGQLDPGVVAKVIRTRKSAIIACYERALKRNPGLSGKVELLFTVSAIGKVTGAEIGSDTMHDDETNQCMVRTVQSWRFPPPADGGEVHFAYPFIFQSSK